MNIHIDANGNVTVSHGTNGRERTTRFDIRHRARHVVDSVLERPPTLNDYEVAELERFIKLIENAVTREDTPSLTFDDVAAVVDYLPPNKELILSRTGVDDVEVLAITKVEPEGVNNINGVVSLKEKPDADRIEVRYKFNVPRAARLSGF